MQVNSPEIFAWLEQQGAPSRSRGLPYAGQQTFLGFPWTQALQGVELAILGVPFDSAATFRPGARFGPRALRDVSRLVGAWPQGMWPWTYHLSDKHLVIDYGDVTFLPFGTEAVFQATLENALALHEAGASVLALGGDHFVAGPLIRAAAKVHGPLALVHLDAHSDNWEVKEIEHHGNFLSGLIQEGLVEPARSIQVGLRTPQPEALFQTLDMDWLSDHGMEQAAHTVKERVGSSKAYLTLDIDVLDPGCAPGTGTPVAGGLLTREARRLLRGLAGLSFVGADLVEVSPPYDTQQITAIAGATLAVDLLYLLSHARP